jgi:hypothetical protein
MDLLSENSEHRKLGPFGVKKESFREERSVLVSQPSSTNRLQMNRALHRKLVTHVNRKAWWHVPPVDPDAYRKRGKFLSSSFSEARFWGRPLNHPQTASIANPLVGDEATIEKRLFGKRVSTPDLTLDQRFRLDAEMKRAAVSKGYDSILLMTPGSFMRLKSEQKLPRSFELNILVVS